ncbi:MAG: HD domain-containing protein [Chlamydiia bacterium]|nr:HD domain-containing protein [Chlamydiia bacterium]MCP5509743.1 HD domain-containing protein [Chlamydiales bacterium]
MHKKIYDRVHGFIHFNELENLLLSSIPMQRLYHIRQLGVAFLVYPGGTHSRFEHSIGVMELATRIYDQVYQKPHQLMPEKGSPEYTYWRQIVRFGALCHDLGHLPFSHVAERALLDNEGHEGWTRRIIQSDYLMPIWEKLDPKRDVAGDVIKIAAPPPDSEAHDTPWERTCSNMITGDFFGSDRIDYLVRDAQATGLNYGLFDYHQMIEMMRVLPALDQPDTLQLGIEENGLESCEALLLARHFMHKRIYKYPAVKAYAYHLEEFMKKAYSMSRILESVDSYIYMSDNEVLADINAARRNVSHPAHHDAIRLLQRKDHIAAIPIKEQLSKSALEALAGKHAFSFEHKEPKSSHMTMPFPVLLRDGSIQEGTQLSGITIPRTDVSWVFVEQDKRKQIAELVEKSCRHS